MPIYEYLCSNCQTKFEVLRPIKDSDAPIDCSNCHSAETRRVQSTCFSNTGQNVSTPSSTGCAGCSGGSCSSCSH